MDENTNSEVGATSATYPWYVDSETGRAYAPMQQSDFNFRPTMSDKTSTTTDYRGWRVVVDSDMPAFKPSIDYDTNGGTTDQLRVHDRTEGQTIATAAPGGSGAGEWNPDILFRPGHTYDVVALVSGYYVDYTGSNKAAQWPLSDTAPVGVRYTGGTVNDEGGTVDAYASHIVGIESQHKRNGNPVFEATCETPDATSYSKALITPDPDASGTEMTATLWTADLEGSFSEVLTLTERNTTIAELTAKDRARFRFAVDRSEDPYGAYYVNFAGIRYEP
jgi:hypothetical protein